MTDKEFRRVTAIAVLPVIYEDYCRRACPPPDEHWREGIAGDAWKLADALLATEGEGIDWQASAKTLGDALEQVASRNPAAPRALSPAPPCTLTERERHIYCAAWRSGRRHRGHLSPKEFLLARARDDGPTFEEMLAGSAPPATNARLTSEEAEALAERINGTMLILCEPGAKDEIKRVLLEWGCAE